MSFRSRPCAWVDARLALSGNRNDLFFEKELANASFLESAFIAVRVGDGAGAIADRDKEIFSLPLGKPGTPSTVASKTLVFAVKERKDLDPEEVKKGLDTVRAALLESKREMYFSNWIQDAQKKMQDGKSIKINQAALTQIIDTAR